MAKKIYLIREVENGFEIQEGVTNFDYFKATWIAKDLDEAHEILKKLHSELKKP